MPNWCNNTVTLRHRDRATALEAARNIRAGEWLENVRPTPAPLLDIHNADHTGEPDWYTWRLANWGCRSDVFEPVLLSANREPTYEEIEDAVEKIDDEWVVRCAFDTAWSPPVEAYAHLSESGWRVHAFYDEPGMGFCGRYSSEHGDEGIDYPDEDSDEATREEWAQSLPSDLEQCYSLRARILDRKHMLDLASKEAIKITGEQSA